MGTSLLWALASVGGAEAREYQLHPVTSGVSIPQVLTITPWEVDVTDPDYTLVFDVRNDTGEALLIPMQGARCVRGGFRAVAHGRGRPLVLGPFEVKRMEIRCDHGEWVTGDFGLVLPEVATNPSGDRRTPGEVLVTDVTWMLRERDLARNRQRSGKPLACLTYKQPAEAVEPEAVAADADPDALAAPAATLRPR